jgi:hypothetical protein
LGVFVVGCVDMDGEDLKILNSPIERYGSIKEDPNMVGFLGRILDKILDGTRFGFGHQGVLNCKT